MIWLNPLRRALRIGSTSRLAPGLNRSRAKSRDRRLQVEPLEGRITPTTITVTTSSDAVVHDNVSLRDAIALANVDSSSGLSDTIVFDSSLQGKTIQLAQGPFSLTGTGSITIDAASNQITLNGSGIGNILTVANGTTATIAGFTLTNGKVISGTANVQAGAIENDGILGINNCIINGNSAITLLATGNAMGGGIYNTGTLTITNSLVTNSVANAGNMVLGGGIFNSGTLTVTNTHVDNNTTTGAASEGSGIYNSGTLIVDTNSSISNDTANGAAGPYIGGGIYSSPTGSVSLDSVTIQNDTAVGGGGGIFSDITGTTAGSVSVSNSTISNNSGGGIHAQGNLTLTNTNVENNTLVGNDGAGIFSSGTGSISGGTISGNTVTDSAAGQIASAGVYSTGPLTVANVTITGNSGTSSGSAITSGVGLYCSAALTVTGSTISTNTGTTSGTGTFFGAGIFGGANVTISGSTVSGNSATDSSTGALAGAGIYSTGILSVTNTTISNNSLTSTSAGNITGGGVFSPAAITLNNATITGNASSTTAAGNITGAGVYAPAAISITGSTISSNTATTGTGTVLGVGLYTTLSSTIVQTTIDSNIVSIATGATVTGIGIYNTGVSTLLASTVSHNTASAPSPSLANGGGIFNGGVMTLSESTIYGNAAANGGGLLNALGNGVGTATLAECTFADNTASIIGGGIYNQGNMVLRSTIMANDSAPAGPDVGVNGSILAQILLGEHDLIQNASGLEGTEIQDGVNENIIGHDPVIFDVLANYGGPTDTIPLLLGSPAFANGGDTDTTAPIDNMTQTIPIENTAVLMSSFVSRVIQLDDEQMLVTGFNLAAETLTVQRGYNNTMPEPHDKFTHVFPVTDQLGLNRVTNNTTDIGASTFIKDIEPPVVTITGNPDPITNSTTATFTFTATDDLTPVNQLVFEVSLDGALFAVATSPVTFTDLPAGTHTFVVEAKSLQGNVGTSPTFSWIIDTKAPVVTFGSTPHLFSNSTSASFTFSGTDDITPPAQLLFAASLDGGDFTPVTSPATITGLPAGVHTYQVEAKDQAGNVGQSPVFQWTVDLTNPTVTITGGPQPATNSTSATFSFSGTDNVTSPSDLVFMYSLDGSDFAAATNPLTLNGLSSADHKFSVESVDQAGNDSTPQSFTWTVDAILPTVQINPTPPAFTMSTSETISFTGSDNRTPPDQLVFQVSLDGSKFATAISPVTFTGLSVGVHKFQVQDMDQVGNFSNPPATFTWTIDQTPPTAFIGSTKPANPSNQKTAKFTFAGTDNASAPGNLSFDVSLDGLSFSPATSPVSFTGLADGNHTFEVEATDQAGNVSLPASYSWVVDTVIPTVAINKGPDPITNQTTAAFDLSGTDNLTPAAQLTFQFSLDGVAFVAGTNPLNLTGLSSGSHTIAIESVDQAGNDSNPASFTWTVDTTAPTITVTKMPPPLANGDPGMFIFTGNDNLTPAAQLVFQYSLNGAAFVPATSPLSLSGLASGSYTITIEDIDQAKNVSTPFTYTWTVDADAPTVTLGITPPVSTQSPLATFTFTGADNMTPASQLVFESSLDGSDFSVVTSPVSLDSLPTGPHKFTVEATDLAGNVSTPVVYTWNIDTTPPMASITQKPPATSFVTTATFAFTGTDDVDTPAQLQFKVSLDSAAFLPASSPVSYSKLVLGMHTFQVEAIDRAGNISPVVSYSWQVATPPPASELQFTATGYGVARTQSTIGLVVTRTGSVAAPVTVDFATSGGSAVAGTNFKSASGTVTFPIGALTETIPLTILNPGALGAGGKFFTVTLSNATNGATLTSNQAVANVTINHPLPQDPIPGNLAAVAASFTHSAEALADFVVQAYTVYLHRPPEQNGLNFWTGRLASGLTDQGLEAQFIGSPEYIQNHGGTGAGWVTGMYEDLLGRAPDPNGLAFWVGQVQAGISPVSIALGFAASPEREGNILGADYEIYLGRAIDPASESFYLQQFANGVQNEDIVAALVGSAEYYNNLTKGQQNKNQWVSSAIEDVLHRPASAGDISFWSGSLN